MALLAFGARQFFIGVWWWWGLSCEFYHFHQHLWPLPSIGVGPAPLSTPICDNPKCLQTLTNVSEGEKSYSFEDHCLRRQSFLLKCSEHGPYLAYSGAENPPHSFFRLPMSCTCRNVQNIVVCSGDLNFEYSLGESHLQQNLSTVSMKYLYRWPPFYDGSAYNFLTWWWYKSVRHSVEMYSKW